jgi:hypothetical protein
VCDGSVAKLKAGIAIGSVRVAHELVYVMNFTVDDIAKA